MNNKKIDNKIYNSIEPDDKFSKTVLEECLSKIKNNPLPDDDWRHEADETLGFLWIEPPEGPFDGWAFRDAPRLHAGGAGRALARKC